MNTKSIKKVRVIIRQWTPRTCPYSITRTQIHEFITEHYSFFNLIIYAGWCRRYDVAGKRRIGFYIATGETSTVARKLLKESKAFGTEIWELVN